MFYILYTYKNNSNGILFRPLVTLQNEFKTHAPYSSQETS
jgi:hypothetical protein